MHLYQHGMDLTLISQWLGHAHLDTTLIYSHADTEQKRKAIEQSMDSKNPLVGKGSSLRYQVNDEEVLKKLYGLKWKIIPTFCLMSNIQFNPNTRRIKKLSRPTYEYFLLEALF